MTPTPNPRRLIEEYIPIKAISAEASREKSIRHGHISTLHLWWARRPLVASRAAVFAALVPADAQPQLTIKDDTTGKYRPMTITEFMVELCKWEVRDEVIEEARRLIGEAYPNDPPKVLDMFAGGGSIPLEALRLGAQAYALDLNPVAHIIELATLVYPQTYGPKLAEDVRQWGDWVLERVRAEVGDLYPLIPDPDFDAAAHAAATHRDAADVDTWRAQKALFTLPGDQLSLDDASPSPHTAALPPSPRLRGRGAGGEGFEDDEDLEDDDLPLAGAESGPGGEVPPGYLQPVAYLWTRTVRCSNPACGAAVPLVRQTWLKKKKGDNIALAVERHPAERRMAFHVRKAADPAGFGFDPAGFSQRGNSVCGFCGATVTADFIKAEGVAGRMSAQLMATVCVRSGAKGKVYLSPDDTALPVPDDEAIRARIAAFTAATGITPPDEPIQDHDTLNFKVPLYGMRTFSDLFTARQLLTLLTFVGQVRAAHAAMLEAGVEAEYAKAVTTYLGLLHGRTVNYMSTLCIWAVSGEFVVQTYGRQALPMTWDFAETQCVAGTSGSIKNHQEWIARVLDNLIGTGNPARVDRGTATSLPLETSSLDAIVTDPPYYDNISYSDLSDFFYVWYKRVLGHLYPQHLTSEVAPKKSEAIMAEYRHADKSEAREFYERAMSVAFSEASRVLSENGNLTIVYAHKTTAGWSTLVDALRTAGFSILEAWPIDTERPTGLKVNVAALASSIFLVARKRSAPVFRLDHSLLDGGHVLGSTGQYLTDVQPEMQRIVKERVNFFLEMGVTGADLNIAAVGAGLAPFTKFSRVELPNGEELTSAAYLDEVQSEVVRALLGERAQADAVTRFAMMSRDYYGEAWVDFDELNTLARATGVELDTGASALTRGAAGLVEKKGAKMRLRDYRERGNEPKLGLPPEEGGRAPLIDVLQRLLWLVEHDHAGLEEFRAAALPSVDKYLLRLTAQTLGGRALAAEPTPGAVRDERSAEQRAIDTLLASWRRVVEEGKML